MNPEQPYQPQQPVTPPPPVPTQPYQPQQPTAYSSPVLPPPPQTTSVPQPTASPAGDPYNFIMSPDKPAKRGIKLGGGNLPVTLGIIVGAATILIVLIVLFSSLLSGGNSSKSNLISLAQTQTEIMRVSDKGQAGSRSQTVKNLAVTINMSVSSQQHEIIGVLGKNGVKLDEKDLKLKQNGQTDQRLTAAKNTNTFDKEFTQVMQESLEAYANSLRQANGAAKSRTEQELTKKYITQTELLIAQIPYSNPE